MKVIKTYHFTKEEVEKLLYECTEGKEDIEASKPTITFIAKDGRNVEFSRCELIFAEDSEV